MTNTYNTYLDHNNCYRNKLYQYLHIFRQPQFLMGVGLNISISTYQVAPGGINNHNFPIAYTLQNKKNIIISPPKSNLVVSQSTVQHLGSNYSLQIVMHLKKWYKKLKMKIIYIFFVEKYHLPCT